MCWAEVSASNSSCDRHTGACDTGCLSGWMEVNCTQECSSGKYGANCTSLCSDRHCAGNSSCDHVTGSCDSGCKAGWVGVDCKEECDSQHYGNKCNMSCSSRHCMKNSSCNATGICVGGCEAGWTGDDCTGKVATHTPSQQPEAASFPVAAVVGAVVVVVVILLLVLAVIMIRRRRGESHGRSAHKTVFPDNVKTTQAEDIGMYMNIGFDNDEKPTLSPEKTSAKQMKAHRQTESEGNSTGEAVSTTGSKDTGKGGTADLDLQKVEEEEDYDVSEQPAQVEDKPEGPDRNYYNLDDKGRDHVIPVSELHKKGGRNDSIKYRRRI
ncbi:multiple epidermal growth factor-like domains protein 10 isoform X3 [Haliotis rubra]|uniref:multiple epidermal growth factor-like domains protein 10 isoform X3 n=1 Tax=Haliotis rubra TaxID=36100 RepID=UPI001EE5BF9B|nr:multiple epidermal growth factor-like domains protein 10 isoform X3 [Haliotis rubra]